MGQQQLLLIVLGVIIVGIAVVVGINLFNANAEESAKDTLVSEGTNLGAMAQQYFKKPIALGGGGNSFVGFGIAPTTTTPGYELPLRLTHSNGVEIWVVSIAGSATGVQLEGTPDPATGYLWTVQVDVDAEDIVARVVNP